MKKIILFLLFFFIQFVPVFAQSFYNINSFYSDRDSGMGGAFTAISDDPSGSFYNPAGLAFIYNDTVTSSSVNYSLISKTYEDVLGPSQYLGNTQNYVQVSKTFNPGFIGVVKSLDKYKVGFSILNPISESLDQLNISYNPAYVPVSEIRIRNSQERGRFLVGPSFARTITQRLSFGVSLFGIGDNARNTTYIYLSEKNGNYSQDSTEYRRTSYGLMPVLGLQYMPTDKLSLGLSIRHTFFTEGTERLITMSSSNSTTNSSGFNILDSSNDRFASIEGTPTNRNIKGGLGLIGNPQLTGRIPEISELRVGGAFFANKRLIISSDIIYTSGYEKKLNLASYDINQRLVKLYGAEVERLNLEATWNYAIGFEFYLTENIALRMGHFSNYSNTPEIKKGRYLERLIAQNASGGDTLYASNGNLQLLIQSPLFSTTGERNDHIDLFGYSIGLSYETSRNTISFTIVNQTGRGLGTLGGLVPSNAEYNNLTGYLGSTIRY